MLDTDGVNAFASPGGIVHITRGALGLITSEAELAGVLAHEIGHVAHKHTVNAIRKNKAVQLGANETLSSRGAVPRQASRTRRTRWCSRTSSIAATRWTRTRCRRRRWRRRPATRRRRSADFLTRLDERNKDQPERNGLFASHPETKERIDTIRQAGAGANGQRPTCEARYKANIKYKPTPVTAIAVVADGASGLDRIDQASDEDDKKEEPKKKGFGLGT